MTAMQSRSRPVKHALGCIPVCSLIFLHSSIVSGATIRIPADQPTIQAGIDAAQESDILLLADGLFTGEGNRNITFRDKSIAIRSEHGSSGCIIDCELLGSGFVFDPYDCISASIEGITITHAIAERGAGFYFGFNAGVIELIDLVITDNTASMDGGAIYCDSFADVHLTDCILSDNVAESAGGAVFTAPEAVFTVEHCTIANNQAAEGGGIRFGQSRQTVVRDCYITGNSAGIGGGVMCAISASPEIIACVFESNTAEHMGGAVFCTDSEPVISGCQFQSNESFESGGAVYSKQSTLSIDSTVFTRNRSAKGGALHTYSDDSCRLDACEFTENQAQATGGAMASNYGSISVDSCLFSDNQAISGGAIDISGGQVRLNGCEVLNNSATESGGGLYMYGREYVEFDIHLERCLIVGNRSNQGGGCFMQGGIASMAYCDFRNNHADADGGGSYLSRLGDDTILDHCIWAGNTATGTSGAIHSDYIAHLSMINVVVEGNSAARFGFGTFEHNPKTQIFQCTITNNRSELNVENLYIESAPSVVFDNTIIWNNTPSFMSSDVPTVRYSIVQDGESGPGVIHADPRMIGGNPFDLRLMADSPCIDAGTDRYAIDRDLEGNPRPQGGATDMGAFEYGGFPSLPHVYLSMPGHDFAPGDPVSLTAQIWNPSTETIRDARFFVVLMYLDTFYFMPSGYDLAHYEIDFAGGMSDMTIISSFLWPEAGFSQEQALWYGIMLDPGMTQVLSNLCVYDFDWRTTE